MNSIPRSKDLVAPLLKVLSRGGILTNQQIHDGVAEEVGLSIEDARLIHSGSRTELEYRLAWARTFAKQSGLIESPSRMHWSITEKGMLSQSGK